MTKDIEFDPGFSKLVQVFSTNIGYIYNEFSRFKVFSQKQFQFQRFYSTIRDLLDKQVAFSLGCLLWAVYLKSLPQGEIVNNHCLGTQLSQEDYCKETDFTLNYFEQIKKDTQYYLHLAYEVPNEYYDIVKKYKEFLILNEGFTDTKLNTDVKLPSLKKVSEIDLALIKNAIDESISVGNITKLFELSSIII